MSTAVREPAMDTATVEPGPGRDTATALPPGTAAIAWAYVAGIAAAESLTALVSPAVGLPLHGVILLALLYHGGSTRVPTLRALLWTLAIAPVIRFLSLAPPLARLPAIYWFAAVGVPLFVAVVFAARALGYGPAELGLVLRLRYVPSYLIMLPLGIGLGWAEYRILGAQSLDRTLSFQALWPPALILSVCTGLCEELIFRGLLQHAAIKSLGPVAGMLLVTVLFGALHTGYLSAADVAFVLLVGGFFAVYTYWTKSIYGATLCHSALNVTFYLIWPLLLPPS